MPGRDWVSGCRSGRLLHRSGAARGLADGGVDSRAQLDEIRALTLAMRDSGEKFSRRGWARLRSTSTRPAAWATRPASWLRPSPRPAALAVPMISGRALGHTGGTLDKLESIPGYRTALSLSEFETVLAACGASIVSQTPALVPADRVLYALRDRTGTVESPGLICASILSKKLAAGLDALVLDVKTGSGAFLRKREDAEYLAALMVATAEAAGTRTVALLTDMDQPLGSPRRQLDRACRMRRASPRPAARFERGPARALPDTRGLDDSPGREGGIPPSWISIGRCRALGWFRAGSLLQDD